jgi:hypothetical protein
MKNSLGYSVCQCGSDGEETGISWFRPAMDLDQLAVDPIRETTATTDTSQEIEIHYTEAMKMLTHLEDRTTIEAMQNEHLRYAIQDDFPDEEVHMTLSAVHHFFSLMRVYFGRTLGSSNSRFVSIEQLRCELGVYLWTLLSEWVQTYCDDATQNHVLQEDGPNCVVNADFGASAAVLEFWENRIDDIVGVLVWRDEEVRWRRMECGILLCVLVLMFVWVAGAALFTDVGSHVTCLISE